SPHSLSRLAQKYRPPPSLPATISDKASSQPADDELLSFSSSCRAVGRQKERREAAPISRPASAFGRRVPSPATSIRLDLLPMLDPMSFGCGLPEILSDECL
ncbi:hypothetical protein PanWU01x14_118840, partial [Parasponia andersonii]